MYKYLINNKKNQFLLLVFIMFVFFALDPHNFWIINIVPYDPEINFFDLRYLQYLSIFFDKIFLSSDELYTLKPDMVINYPRAWIIISKITNIADDKILYSIYFVTFVFYVYIFTILIRKFNSYFLFYIFFSGASFLLLERGNVDIFIFIILFYNFFYNRKFYTSSLVYIFLVILKAYPCFSILSYLEEKHFIKKIFFLSIIVLFYFYLFKSDAYYWALNSPKSGDATYGVLSILLNIKKHFNIELNYLFISILNLVFFLLLYFVFIRKKILKENITHRKIFLVGAGIYCCTFLLNTHHDYRLIHLVFCVPLILSLKNNTFKNIILFNLFLAMELQRLIFFIGFYGGVINSISKLIIFYIFASILLSILEIKILNIKYFNKFFKC